MARGHVLAGAAAWLAGSAAAAHYGHHQSPVELVVGTVVCAGSALLPDLDLSGRVTSNEGGATVARTFGVVSLFVAECVEKVSLAVYSATRWRDKPRRSGHRTLTHTLPAAGLAGVGATELCTHQGRWGAVAVLFLTFGLAYRGLLAQQARRAGWLVVTLASLGAALVAYPLLPAGRGFPLIGVAVGAGWLAHLAADCLTCEGCPLLWPIPIGGRTWRMIRIPLVSCKTGGVGETRVWAALFVVVAVLAVLALLVPGGVNVALANL